MKKIISIFILFFLSVTSVGAVDITGGLQGGSSVPVTSTEDNVVVPSNLEEVFCGKHLIGKGKIAYVTEKENKAIIETFSNTFGREILKENGVTSVEVGIARKSGSKAYDEILNLCLQLRQEGETEDRNIDNLYKQVSFFSRYYEKYPEKLKEGIMPGFLIYLLDAVETLSFWLVWISLFNVLFWGFVYGISRPENKVDVMKRVKQGFIYLVILWAIKVGIFGTMVSYLGYESLELFKILLNF